MLSSVVLEPTLGGANALQLYARFLTTDKALIDSKFLDEAIPPVVTGTITTGLNYIYPPPMDPFLWTDYSPQ